MFSIHVMEFAHCWVFGPSYHWGAGRSQLDVALIQYIHCSPVACMSTYLYERNVIWSAVFWNQMKICTYLSVKYTFKIWYVLVCQIYFHSSRSLDDISRSRTFSLNQVVFRFYCNVTKGSNCRDSFSKVIVVYENLKKKIAVY